MIEESYVRNRDYFLGQTVMNIVAGFILVLVVVYLIIKCVLSYMEERKYMDSQMQKKKKKEDTAIEMISTSVRNE